MRESELDELNQENQFLTQEDGRFESAILGRDIEHWIDEDPIGRFVIGRAREEIEEVKEALLTETDSLKIQALQQRAAVCNRIRQWLGEAVRDGQAAAVSLQQERDSHHAD